MSRAWRMAGAAAMVLAAGASPGLGQPDARADAPAALASPGQSAALPAGLTLEARMLLRCSAAFAIASARQAAGDEEAAAWPALARRGRAFFVLAGVQLMDEAGLDRATLARALEAEAQQLAEPGALAPLMTVCLPLLPEE